MFAYQKRPVVERYTFNLAEILMALVVLAVGTISIIGLLGGSQKSSGTAVSKSGSADAADQFMRFFASKMKLDWTLANRLPISQPGAFDESEECNWSATDSYAILTDMEGVTLHYDDQGVAGAFDPDDDSGLFKIAQRTDTAGEDFTAILRVWRTPTTYKSFDAPTNTWFVKPMPPDNAATLNVEVSYPAALPYDKRQKQVYQIDVFRPIATSATVETGAFQIPSDGKLKITYHGSNAGWKNVQSFWLVLPEDDASTKTGKKEVMVFESAKTGDQDTTFEQEFTGGSSFNCFIQTNKTVVGNPGPFRHYAWADEDADYYTDSSSDNDGYKYYKGGQLYCNAVEQVPGKQWFFGFEDQPGDNGPDWDFEDCMVTIELISSSTPSVGSVVGNTVKTTTPIKLSNSDGWDCVIVKASDNKLMSTDGNGSSWGAYSGRAVCVWFRPKGEGTQSCLVEGETTTFDNSSLIAISDLSSSMNVDIYESDGDWYLEFEADNSVYTVIKTK